MKYLVRILYGLLISLVLILAVLLLGGKFNLPGNIRFYVVESGSMSPTIKTGSVVMTRPQHGYQLNDIITFKTAASKVIITHRIYDVRFLAGQPSFVTKGDANNAPDQAEVAQSAILGKVIFFIPYLGFAAAFARQPIGFLLLVIIPAGIVIADEVKKISAEIRKLRASKVSDNQDDQA